MMQKSVKELELDRAELLTRRKAVNMEKVAAQAELSKINLRAKTTLPFQQYQSLERERSEWKRIIAEKEIEGADLFVQAKAISAAITMREDETKPTLVKQFLQLRDSWHAMSMDAENHQKAREAYWKCSQDAAKLLKIYFTEK